MRMLTEDDREMLLQLLEPNSKSLSMALTQVWVCETKRKRMEKFTGGLCFYKDFDRKGYFQSLFCLKTKSLIWEKEITKNTIYVKRKHFVHTIKSKDHDLVVYHFAELKEADDMMELVTNTIEDLHQGKEDFELNHNQEIDDFFQELQIGIEKSNYDEDDARKLVFSWMNDLVIEDPYEEEEEGAAEEITNNSSSTDTILDEAFVTEELPISNQGISFISQRRQEILEQLRKAGVQ